MKKLDIYHNVDRSAKKSEYRVLNTATAAAFSPDGLEIAFIAGGDLWVMDTELREPKRVTNTPDEEAEPLFSRDGQSILFIASFGDRFAIARAERAEGSKFWWQNDRFNVRNLVKFHERPSKLKLSPDGKKLAFVKGRGDLCVLDLETAGEGETVVFADWSSPDFDWSPDGKWFVYSKLDSDFNRDIWLLPSDGKGKPLNVSRHPYSESDPVWSPDGKMIAFAGRRASGEPGADVCIVSLQMDDDERTARDRKLEKALDKMKSRTPQAEQVPPMKAPGLTIDFDRLDERVKRVNLGDGFASKLFWSPDARKLAFTGNFEGKPGTYTIDIGDTLTPKALTTTVGARPVWLKKGNQIVWLVGGVPTSTPGVAVRPPPLPPSRAPTVPKKGGKGGYGSGGCQGQVPRLLAAARQPRRAAASPSRSARKSMSPARNAVIFDTCWRTMRDHWYDSNLGNNDWDKVRAASIAPLPRSVPTTNPSPPSSR